MRTDFKPKNPIGFGGGVARGGSPDVIAGGGESDVVPIETHANVGDTQFDVTFSDNVTGRSITGWSFTINGSPVDVTNVIGANSNVIVQFDDAYSIQLGNEYIVTYNGTGLLKDQSNNAIQSFSINVDVSGG